MSIVMTAGAMLTVPVLFLLVPRWGGEGAAVASAATYFAVGVLTAVIFARVAGLPLRQCWLPDREDVEAVIVGTKRLVSRRRSNASAEQDSD
jgi:Na+-driven multidrug efflux pump